MAKKYWTVALPDRVAAVTLDYSFWNCRHRLWVDDHLVFDKRILLEFGTEYEFELAGHRCILHIDVPGRLTFDYSLTVDGREIAPQSDPLDHGRLLFVEKPASRGDSAFPTAM